MQEVLSAKIKKVEPLKSEIFIPAKTIKEANEYATKTLSIKQADYKGCDIVSANEWNKGLFDSFKQFPELKERIKFVGECHQRNIHMKPVFIKVKTEQYYKWYKKNNPQKSDELTKLVAKELAEKDFRSFNIKKSVIAQSYHNDDYLKDFSGITVNKEFGKNSKGFIAELKKGVVSKHSPEGTDTIRSILDHEIAHQLDHLLDISKEKVIIELYSVDKKDITEGLSKYAWDNKNKEPIREFVSEGWAEYCNNPNPRKMATIIGETIVKRYAEWKKSL